MVSKLDSKTTGWLAIVTGMLGILAVLSLLLFFAGLFWNISSLSATGALNDTLNIFTGISSALLAAALSPALPDRRPRVRAALLAGVWAGALAVTYGSWLIQTGRADVELSSYYFFLGNGLIGIWLWVLNGSTRRQGTLPRRLTVLGSIAAALMMWGLPALYGILLGLDGNDYSPLIMLTGVSFLGTGILYPAWCLWLGRSLTAHE